MEPLRVAIFGESYLPYLSGVTVATEALARGLGAAGQRVMLVAPRPAPAAGESSAGAIGPDPAYGWLPSYQGPPPSPPDYRMPWPVPSAALRRARGFRPHVVHAQSPFVSGLMARRVARSVGAPLVFTHHTRFADYRHYLGPLAAPGAAGVAAYLRAFWTGCDAVVAPSGDLAGEIEAALRDRRRGERPIVRAIPTGLELEALRSLTPIDPRLEAGWPPDSIVAVSVGRLAREKNVEVLLEAVAAAARDVGSLRLLLVGDGPLRGRVEQRARGADLAGRVHLAGRLPRPEALALAAGASCFCFASLTETQGLVLAEALALGLPVVALDGPGVADTVRAGVDGTVVGAGPGEGDRLAGALVEVAADAGLRARLSRAALEGSERFAIGSRIGEMLDLYRTLLASSQRRR
jgi:1,2-diacylglycerol 3-alpha-glucosyltransferase